MAKKTEGKKQAEMVSVPLTQWNDVLKTINEYKQSSNRATKLKRVTEHEANLATYDGQLVIGFSNAKENPRRTNKNDEFLINLKVLTLEGEEKMIEDVEWLPWVNTNKRTKVKILKQEAATREAVDISEGGGGYIQPRKLENDEVVEGVQIPLAVTFVTYLSTVEVMHGPYEGKQITLANEYLNP